MSNKPKTPEEKIMSVIYGDKGVEISRRAKAKREAEERRKRMEAVIPKHVLRILDKTGEETRIVLDLIDKITPDGSVLLPKKDWLEKNTPQYVNVYNLAHMLDMFHKGVDYGERRFIEQTTPTETEYDKKIEGFVMDYQTSEIGDIPGDISARVSEWAVEMAKRVFAMGVNAGKGRFHSDR